MPGEEEHRVGTSAAALLTRQSNAPSTKPTTATTTTTNTATSATTSKAVGGGVPTAATTAIIISPEPPKVSQPPLPTTNTTATATCSKAGVAPAPVAASTAGCIKSPPRPQSTEQLPSATPPPPPPPSLQVKPKIRLNSKSPESDEIEREPAALLTSHPKLPAHFLRGTLEEDDDDDEDELDDHLAPNADGEDSSIGSKLEMELQFAGVDIENEELDAEDEDNFPSTELVSRRVGGPLLHGGGAPDSTAGEDKEVEKPKDQPPAVPTMAEKALFYTTATFILMAIFSLFLFLFLVPFVIDPAFSTIFMEFDPEPALCITESVVNLTGQTKCNWTSCKEGCTRELFSCTQVHVNYWVRPTTLPPTVADGVRWGDSSGSGESGSSAGSASASNINRHKFPGGGGSGSGGSNNNYYNYQVGGESGGRGLTEAERLASSHKKKKHKGSSVEQSSLSRGGSGHQTSVGTTAKPGDTAGRLFKNARLFPNVKGCGYPPAVNCSLFHNQYAVKGRNFSCFYSKVNPFLVITKFDMNRVILELALSMAIPIPCFIISVIYLVFAYFRIYNKPESTGAPTANNIPSSTNNNIAGGGGGVGGPGSSEPDAETSLSTTDEKTRIIQRSTSHGLNAVSALTDKLIPNSGKGLLAHAQIEMNDLTPMIRTPADGDFILPSRNNRAPERNGPTNPAAKNKGEMNGHGSNQATDTPGAEKYLEPGFLPERINSLPPIEISHSRNALNTITQIRDSRIRSTSISNPEDGTKL